MNQDEAYKLAVSTRQFEIQMFWQRSNYFMVLNTAIAVGFFALKNDNYEPILAALGFSVSILWFFTSLGGKYWQSRWEQAAHRLELECCPEAKLFAASPEFVKQEVEQHLSVNNHHIFRRWIDRQILRKPSVSYQMTTLSLLFAAFWSGTFIIFLLIKNG